MNSGLYIIILIIICIFNIASMVVNGFLISGIERVDSNHDADDKLQEDALKDRQEGKSLIGKLYIPGIVLFSLSLVFVLGGHLMYPRDVDSRDEKYINRLLFIAWVLLAINAIFFGVAMTKYKKLKDLNFTSI